MDLKVNQKLTSWQPICLENLLCWFPL